MNSLSAKATRRNTGFGPMSGPDRNVRYLAPIEMSSRGRCTHLYGFRHGWFAAGRCEADPLGGT